MPTTALSGTLSMREGHGSASCEDMPLTGCVIRIATGEGLERSSGTHGGTGLSAPTVRLLHRSTLSASENMVPTNGTQSR